MYIYIYIYIYTYRYTYIYIYIYLPSPKRASMLLRHTANARALLEESISSG